MAKLLIKNIDSLWLCAEDPLPAQRKEALHKQHALQKAWLAVEDGTVLAYGPMSEWGGITDWRNLEVFDAEGRHVFPGFCDSHTHLIFAASREQEFEGRIKGLTYQQIAAAGGGILNSAARLQQMSEDELFDKALNRIREIARTGTTAVEIKTGYGLTPEAELKMARVIHRLQQAVPLTVVGTFLGAHAIPQQFKASPDAYVDLVINEMLPQIAESGACRYIDVFCEHNYFTVAQMEGILQAGAQAGLKPKVHVNQFTSMGAVALAVAHGAISVDHLEEMTEADFDALINSKTVATALPLCSLFLGIPFAPLRQLIDRGAIAAIATDFNPGSSPSGSMPMAWSLACMRQKLTPYEALVCATTNGAHALELGNVQGSIAPGMPANFIITHPIPSLAHLPYAFTTPQLNRVYANGTLVYDSENPLQVPF